MRRLLVAGSLCVARAHAQAGAEDAVRLQYTAPLECPDSAAIMARVRARTDRGRLAEPGELARVFALRIESDPGGGFWGTIEFLDDAGSSVSRRVHGGECDEVVSSLALITALALDASLSDEKSDVAHTAPPTALLPEPRIAAEPARPMALAPSGEKRQGRGPSGRVGAAGGYAFMLDAFSTAVLGQLDFPVEGSSLVDGFALRLNAHHESGDREVAPGRRANLRLLGLAASACPRARRLSLWNLRLYPCLVLDLGSLRGRGLQSQQLTFPSSKTIFWLAWAAELRLAWEPRGPFWLELDGWAGTPLIAHRFVFNQPHVEVFELKAGRSLHGGVAVATGVRFW